AAPVGQVLEVDDLDREQRSAAGVDPLCGATATVVAVKLCRNARIDEGPRRRIVDRPGDADILGDLHDATATGVFGRWKRTGGTIQERDRLPAEKVAVDAAAQLARVAGRRSVERELIVHRSLVEVRQQPGPERHAPPPL